MSWAETAPVLSTARRQEWGLFLLEWLFHTATAMYRRELQCQMQTPPLPPMHSSQGYGLQTTRSMNLLGSTHDKFIELAEDITVDGIKWHEASFPVNMRTN